MRKILSKVKHLIKKMLYVSKYKRYQKNCKKSAQREFLIFNSPIHGNIGDQAIIYAEYKLLDKLSINAFEIPTYEENYYFEYIKKKISKDAIISITGGGFIGSQWMVEENLVNKVIECFSEHEIIIFPATFYFKNDELGKCELEKSIQIINNAKNINIFARERKTYEFVEKTYENAKVSLVPDIVLSLDRINSEERSGILLCLRSDVEGVLSEKNKEELSDIVSNYDKQIKRTDTVVNRDVKVENRNKEIEEKLKEFSASKLVVTDRLHGMIFAVITNTPCVVLENYNHKVRGVYEKWIKDNISNVICVDDVKDVNNAIQKLKNIPNTQNAKFDFKDLTELLEEKVNG